MQRTILCYGDSNTWGCVPIQENASVKERYPREQRWTGVLQDLLGKHYYVIEEGLNGRTTNLDHQLPPDRNGKTYLPPCLYSHAPIDLVILALGGNDMKTYFNRTAEEITEGIADLVNVIQTSQYGKNLQAAPEILLVSTAIPLPVAENLIDENGIHFFKGSIEKAKKLLVCSAELAKKMNCHFIDISHSISPSPIDGLHIDAVAHRKIADLFYKKILDIFTT